MRCGLSAVAILASCGRIGFDANVGDASDAIDGVVDAPTTMGASRIVAYGDHTCAIVRGAAYCWGDNSNGQLVPMGNAKLLTPTLVSTTGGDVTAIALGEAHACFLVAGDLQCSGTTTVATVALSMPITAIGAGHGFTCALADQVYCWGSNDAGQLGVGDVGMHPTPTPTLVSTGATSLSVGDDHACTVVATKAQCWGHNDNGTLGTGSTSPSFSAQPVSVIVNPTLPHIAGWHACTLNAGQVWCWGRGDHGELGNNTMVDNPMPMPVPSLSDVSFLTTGGGPSDFDASCAIASGVTYCWGAGMHGRLGQGSSSASAVPVAITGLPTGAIEIAMGYDHACARYPDGGVWCWGRGDLGQCGEGLGIDHAPPIEIVLP